MFRRKKKIDNPDSMTISQDFEGIDDYGEEDFQRRDMAHIKQEIQQMPPIQPPQVQQPIQPQMPQQVYQQPMQMPMQQPIYQQQVQQMPQQPVQMPMPMQQVPMQQQIQARLTATIVKSEKLEEDYYYVVKTDYPLSLGSCKLTQ